MPIRPLRQSATSKKARGPKSEKRKANRVTRRNASRAKQGKKPLAQPLTMSRGVINGRIYLRDGKRELSFSLHGRGRHRGLLQGVYKIADGSIVIVRLSYSKGLKINLLTLSQITSKGEVLLPSFFYVENDLAHAQLNPSYPLRGQGLGLKLLAKADRHMRSNPQRFKHKKGKGLHVFTTMSPLAKTRIFERLGYKIIDIGNGYRTLVKSGKSNPKNDMNKYHSIEAIDPKTGRVREFVFPVEKRND